MNQKHLKVIFVILLGIAIYLFFQLYTELYVSSSQGYRSFYFAVAIASAGIFSHFMRKHSAYKDKKGQELSWDIIELLMIMATPLVVSFDVFREQYHNNPNLILLVSSLVFGSWYTVSLIRAGRLNEYESKQVFSTAFMLFGLFLFILGIGVALLDFIK